MRDPEKLKEEMDERNRKILDVAFELFVDKKIEAVSMGDIARAADVGRATLFRYYPSKLELVMRYVLISGKDIWMAWTREGLYRLYMTYLL